MSNELDMTVCRTIRTITTLSLIIPTELVCGAVWLCDVGLWMIPNKHDHAK
jgi:hypothetical protein